MVSRVRLAQQRSRLRREQLLAAAIELFAEGGPRAITHRAVAAHAGLPSATTTYYFASIAELTREALGAHLVQWIADLDDLGRGAAEGQVEMDPAAFIGRVFARRETGDAAVELSIYLAAAREPGLRDLAAQAMRSLETLVSHLLTRAGIHGPDHVAPTVVALITGTAMRRQSGAYEEVVEAHLLTAAIRDLVASRAAAVV